jgi:hypothetical protein
VHLSSSPENAIKLDARPVESWARVRLSGRQIGGYGVADATQRSYRGRDRSPVRYGLDRPVSLPFCAPDGAGDVVRFAWFTLDLLRALDHRGWW